METNEHIYDRIRPYHVIIPKYWFRQKPVFSRRLSDYERVLRDKPSVGMKLNAGNMIYQMMRRLSSDDWEKQDALVYAYRNLVYKISYVKVGWFRNDMQYLHVTGRKSDVMWALSFLSQVYPEFPMVCKTIPERKEMLSISFSIQDGQYVGQGALQSINDNDVIPDIWSKDEVGKQYQYQQMGNSSLMYDPNMRPKEGQLFALPDGRIANYVGSDSRFVLADKKGVNVDVLQRHNISASLMKDFEDIIRRQTLIEYELYYTRYSAFMNKVHLLEDKIGGLDVSVYDVLPIAERGLPQASMPTIQRTNMMDHDSLKYIIDKVKRNVGQLSPKEIKETSKEAAKSVLSRIRGYNVEYYMYLQTQTNPELCQQIHNDKCIELYNDFAKLDSYGQLRFPLLIYKVLCNEPERGALQMTDVERQVMRVFGHGYLDFLSYQLSHNEASQAWKRIYKKAIDRLRVYSK